MAQFNEFNKSNLKALRNDLQELLNKYGVSSNVEFSVGNMSFSSNEVNVKLNAKIKGTESFADQMLDVHCKMLNIVRKNSKGDELVAFNSRAHKMPFIFVKASDGRRYKCSESQAKQLFAA